MPSAAGGDITYLPRVVTSLIVGFSRSKKKYRVNDLVKVVPVDKEIGSFPKRRPQEMTRLGSSNALWWPDGAGRPGSDYNKDQWEWIEYRTRRIADTKYIGWLASQQADFPVVQAQADSLAGQFMLRREKDFITQLTSSTYPAGNSDTATNFGGGAWTSATTANRYIQKTLQGAARAIQLASSDAVMYSDLTLVISPTVANIIATSQEYAEGLIQSPYALAQLQGKDNWNAAYGLGPTLYGMNLTVMTTMETTTNQNSAGTATTSFTAGSTYAYIIARPGDMIENSGQFSEFSTFALFVFKGDEMKAEQWDEPKDRRTAVSVVDNYQILPVAMETGARITIGS